MNIKICTPVIGKTLDKFLTNLDETQKISNFIELRVDYIAGLSMDHIRKIKSQVRVPAIFTCRSREEGGFYEDKETERVKILQRGIGLFEYVDLELNTVKKHDFSCDKETKIIISYHNFLETPSYWDMQKIIFDMNKFKPDILKIATKINKEYEVNKIYRLITNKPHSENRIVLGMGKLGKTTRIISAILGGYLTFASTEFGETADGQIDIKEMKKILKIFD